MVETLIGGLLASRCVWLAAWVIVFSMVDTGDRRSQPDEVLRQVVQVGRGINSLVVRTESSTTIAHQSSANVVEIVRVGQDSYRRTLAGAEDVVAPPETLRYGSNRYARYHPNDPWRSFDQLGISAPVTVQSEESADHVDLFSAEYGFDFRLLQPPMTMADVNEGGRDLVTVSSEFKWELPEIKLPAFLYDLPGVQGTMPFDVPYQPTAASGTWSVLIDARSLHLLSVEVRGEFSSGADNVGSFVRRLIFSRLNEPLDLPLSDLPAQGN